MSTFEIERLRKLPRRAFETWQGGWVRLPSWVCERDEEPYRPWVGLWVRVQQGTMNLPDLCRPEERNSATMLTALVNFACDHKLAGYRPGKLEVADPALAEDLSGMLAEVGIEVVSRENLASWRRCVDALAEHTTGAPSVPSPLAAPGVTIEAMRRFAEAAKAFYAAAPWEELSDEDLLRIEAPRPPEGLGFATVLGAGGQVYGVSFFRTEENYWHIYSSPTGAAAQGEMSPDTWLLEYERFTGLPFGDADVWEDYDLPVAGEQAYPYVVCFEDMANIRRPDGPTLAFLEGLLRALTDSTDEQIDSGRWTRQVETPDGPVRYTLALPGLLDPPEQEELARRGILPDRRGMERMFAEINLRLADQPGGSLEEINETIRREFVGKTPEEIDFAPRTPLAKAQDLCYQAFDARGRRQMQLARQAIEVCPDCADAYVILAERTGNFEKAADLYARGVEAGERALGKDRFEEDAGYFWGETDTRPYMRARFGLAQSLDAMDRKTEAVGHYQALLDLDPGDSQGVRLLLAPRLIELGRDAAALEVLEKHPDDTSPALLYTRALLAFRAEGDSAKAGAHLRRARQANPYVSEFLLDLRGLPPDQPETYRIGDEDEAAISTVEISEAWETTPGALEWLKAQHERAAKRKKKRRAAAKRKKRRK